MSWLPLSLLRWASGVWRLLREDASRPEPVAPPSYAFQELEQREGQFIHDSRLEEMLSNTPPSHAQAGRPRRKDA